MSLAHGGHLTHGLTVNFSGRAYTFHPLRRATGDRPHRHATRCGHRPTEAQAEADRRRRERLSARSSTSPPSGPSPTRWAPNSWSTWPTSPAWWPPGCIRRPFPTPSGSPPPPTRPWPARGAARSSAAPRTRPVWTRRCSPACRADRCEHVIAGKAVCFLLAATEEFREKQRRTVENARPWPKTCSTAG